MKFRQGLRVNLFCPSRFSWSLLIKSLLCLIILSLLSVFLGVHSYLWAEKSFVREFSLSSLHLDLHQLDEDHPEASLGPAQYLLPNDFLLGNAELCRRGDHFVVPRLLILVKSAIDNRQAREAIRQTWAQRERLEKNSVRLAFVIGRRRNFLLSQHSPSFRTECGQSNARQGTRRSDSDRSGRLLLSQHL